MPQLRLHLYDSPWNVIKDGDLDGLDIYLRHYSAKKYADGRDRTLFIGPGFKLALITPNCDALFAWRKFIDDCDDNTGKRQTGINCSIFRNEGPILSSTLILSAEQFAWDKWPDDIRLYTYVDESKIRKKRDPGRCFRKAGWKTYLDATGNIAHTKNGKLILEKWKEAPDDPARVVRGGNS